MRKVILFALILITFQSNAAITSMTLSNSSAQDCDSVVVFLSGTHGCPNDVITGITHSVSGSIITINLAVNFGFCIPPIPTPTFSNTYTLHLTGIPIGNYTVRGVYSTAVFSTMPSLSITTCCPFYASAGNDTSFCDVSGMILNGNTPPVSSTSNWSVVSGSGNLTNSTIPNTTINNMSYGTNKVVWTVTDASCTTSDTISITNYEPVSNANTEADKMACEDTNTIYASAPIVGQGKWKSHTVGAIISNVNSPSSRVNFVFPKAYTFSWTVTNGSCKSSDTLLVTHTVLDSTPVITELNYVLTSSSAPQYQWYVDNVSIPGATGMSHTAVANGTYKVLASISGCTTGLFSNEIELTTVGITESVLKSNTSISPNPSSGLITIRTDKQINQIAVYDLKGQLLRNTFGFNKRDIQLDLTDLNPNVYMVHIITKEGVSYRKVIIN